MRALTSAQRCGFALVWAWRAALRHPGVLPPPRVRTARMPAAQFVGPASREGPGPLLRPQMSLPGALSRGTDGARSTFAPANVPTGYTNRPFVYPVGKVAVRKVDPAGGASQRSAHGGESRGPKSGLGPRAYPPPPRPCRWGVLHMTKPHVESMVKVYMWRRGEERP